MRRAAIGYGLALLFAAAPSGAEPLALAPPLPAAAGDLLHARPFVLQEGYRPFPDAEPTFRYGTLIVLAVDPALLLPTEENEAVLLAGDDVVVRVNVGHPTGRLIGIVPGTRDLGETLLWFGRVGDPADPRAVADSRARALGAGLRPPPPERIEAARRDATPLVARDAAELLHEAGRLVLLHAPGERDLARALMGRPPSRPVPGPAAPAAPAAEGGRRGLARR